MVAVVEAELENGPGLRRSAATIRSMSSMLRPGGFSQNTCLPASSAAQTISAVKRLGVQTKTASTSESVTAW